MGTFKFTKTVLDNEANAESIVAIQGKIGRDLLVDEVLEYADGDCGGKTCPLDHICVLGHCVKDDAPEVIDEIGGE